MNIFTSICVLFNLFSLSTGYLYDNKYLNCMVHYNFNDNFCKQLNNFRKLDSYQEEIEILEQNEYDYTSSSTSSSKNCLFKLEDFDQNNLVNILDVVGVVNFIIDYTELDFDYNKNCFYGDINNDFNIDIMDVIGIIYYILNNNRRILLNNNYIYEQSYNGEESEEYESIEYQEYEEYEEYESDEYESEEYESEEYEEYEEYESDEYESEEYETEEYEEYEEYESEEYESEEYGNILYTDNVLSITDDFTDFSILFNDNKLVNNLELYLDYNNETTSSEILSNFVEPIETLQLKVSYNLDNEFIKNNSNENEQQEVDSNYLYNLIIVCILCSTLLSILSLVIYKIRKRNRINNLVSMISINRFDNIDEMSNMI